jgi:hypothetical protein
VCDPQQAELCLTCPADCGMCGMPPPAP